MITNDAIMATLLGFHKEFELMKAELVSIKDIKPPGTVDKIYMSVKEASNRYGLSRNLIYDIIHTEGAPYTLKVNARSLLPIKEYDAFMRENYEFQKETNK